MVKRSKEESARKKEVRVELSEYIVRRLHDFCSEWKVEPSTVVERALEEYFHMGDVAH